MTQEEMYILVPQKLKQIEQEYGIRILYAAESGSRAWGTNSYQMYARTSPPTLALRASLSVIMPFDVERITIPRPF